MIRTIIIEDEPDQLEGMQKLLEKYCPEVSVVASAGNKAEAIEAILLQHPDLVFLDIRLMGEPRAGFEVLEAVSFMDFELVFLSSHTEFALHAMNQHRPVCYFLEKPVQIDQTVLAIKKVGEQLQMKAAANSKTAENTRLPLPREGGIDLVWTKDIIRCEADSWLTKVYMNGPQKMLAVSKNLGWFSRALPASQFVRVHNSHIVNLDFVRSYDSKEGGTVALGNGEKIPVGPSFKEALLRRVNQL